MRLELLFISVFMAVFFFIAGAQAYTVNSSVGASDANAVDGICEDESGNYTLSAVTFQAYSNKIYKINLLFPCSKGIDQSRWKEVQSNRSILSSIVLAKKTCTS